MTMQWCKFPAAVITTSGIDERRCAVVVIDGVAELAVQSKRGDFDAPAVQVVATMTGVQVGDPQEGGAVTLTGDGDVWTVTQGDGCGCRSPAQRWFADRIQGLPMGS